MLHVVQLYLCMQRVDRVAGTYNKLLDNMLRSIREEVGMCWGGEDMDARKELVG